LKENEDLISLHQVKAVNNASYSRYRDDFIKLEQKRATYPCSGAYFHVAKQNERDNDALQVDHPTVEFYQYSNANYFCEIKQIEPLIEGLITTYLNLNNLNHLNSGSNLALFRNKLEAIIFSQVIAIHANNHERHGLSISEGAFYFIIPFQSFVDILITDPSAVLDESYYLNTSKMLINDWFMEFTDELEQIGENIDDDVKSKMLNYLNSINALNDEELIQLLKNITPQRSIEFNNLNQFNVSLQKSDFFDGFIRGLYELVTCRMGIEKLVWKCEENKENAITGINNPSSQLQVVAHRILKNIKDNDIEIPYEIDRLITSDLETDSLQKVWNNQNISPEKEEEEGNNITKWGNIGLVKLNNIKNRINEGNN